MLNPPGSRLEAAFCRITSRSVPGALNGGPKSSAPSDIQNCMDSSYQKAVRNRCGKAKLHKATTNGMHSSITPIPKERLCACRSLVARMSTTVGGRPDVERLMILRALIDTFRRSRRWGRRQQRPIAASSGSHRRRRHLGRPHGRKAPVQAGTVGELRRHHTGGGAGAGAGDALRGVLVGDAWAWAGTTTDSTMGLNHLEGMRMATVAPPTNILRTR